MTVAAPALIFDGQITIDRAINSPTLTVKYTHANAALVELRVNGESVATRTVSADSSTGETTFTLNLASLSGGTNKIEVRLFDKAGKLLATETSQITADSSQAPVYLTNPKMGATLQGNVDIKVGFGHEMKNSFVSFFIDNQFKSISNVPPFEFSWDTTRDANGWHEVEAWVVDDTSATYKSRKVRVFVQNKGGNTDRIFPTAKPVPTAKSAAVAAQPAANDFHVGVTGVAGTKPAALVSSVPTGPKAMIPTGKRLALAQNRQLPPASITHSVPATLETGTISIVRGQRLPNIGSFAIVYNTQFVDFDVQPRVTEDGVPLTPFRHLIEKAGGKVGWAHLKKDVSAEADGRSIFLHIGDSFAQINKQRIELERPSFIESGRTIVPLSFMRDALDVNIDYDKATGHVLITSAKK